MTIREPWADDSERRQAADPANPHADYEAFESWLSDWCAKHPGQVAEGIEVAGLLERIELYYYTTSVLEESKIGATP